LTPQPESPFLAAFYVDDGVFDLGGKVFPGSLRDQVIRASLFVELAAEAGFIGKSRKTLCIIGAGVAGVTVALEASARPDLQIWLADTGKRPLGLIRNCDHRSISPTLYDWPAPHSARRRYTGIFDYDEGTPDVFSSRVNEIFDSTVDSNPRLTWCGGTTATPHLHVGDGPPWRVTFDPPRPDAPSTFDAVVLCRGFGKERKVRTKDDAIFPQFSFWEADPYPTHNKLRSPIWTDGSVDRNVAILGGGDGAIQDALRFITDGRDARAILSEITRILPPYLTTAIVNLVGDTENLQRHYACASSSTKMEWDFHSALREIVGSVVSSASRVLSGWISCHSVGIYFKGAMLGPCYPLNRFLALLFQQLVIERNGADILQPEHEVEEIECLHPVEDDCFNNRHSITFVGMPQRTSCSVIVPRLGIESSQEAHQRLGAVRQILPYWLPNWNPRSIGS
jgi:hypothetical protein